MARTIKVEIGGSPIEIPCLNIGQIEEIQDILGPGLPKEELAKRAFKIFRVAMRRAEADLDQLAPTLEEIRKAVEQILESSGFSAKKADEAANPPKGEGSGSTTS